MCPDVPLVHIYILSLNCRTFGNGEYYKLLVSKGEEKKAIVKVIYNLYVNKINIFIMCYKI